jgi:hypothetical protein
MSFRRFMSFVAMAFLWTGSQIPVYLFGESISITLGIGSHIFHRRSPAVHLCMSVAINLSYRGC